MPGRVEEIDGKLIELANADFSFRSQVLMIRLKTLENLLYAYYGRKRKDRVAEDLFKISLAGLLHMLYPKREYLPKRISDVFERGIEYIYDPTLMNFKEAVDLFMACEEAIERLGYTKMERHVDVKRRIMESRGASV